MRKHKQTLAKEISLDTKRLVMERQGYRSITGVALSESSATFHHVIYRSGQGIGAEWNVVALSFDEHRRFHDKQDILVNGRERYTWQEFDTLMKNHLKLWYEGWSESACKYDKYKTIDEYGVMRRERKI